jgi:acetylornithine deacetylase/succinyl-diaminopimelate desuccinylase-like protein
MRSIRPVLDVNGITAGFQGEGANTIIPAKASAKISMRLVPNQDAPAVSKAFDAHLRELCPAGVKMVIVTHGSEADAYLTPADNPALKAGVQALREAFGEEPVHLREGGSLPILPMFKQLLGVDCILLGFASPNCNAHGPNEKVRLPDLDRGAETIVRMFGLLRV